MPLPAAPLDEVGGDGAASRVPGREFERCKVRDIRSDGWAQHGGRLLDRVLIFGRRHLEGILTKFIDHYNHAWSQQGIGQRRHCEPAEVLPLPTGRVERRDGLGGVLQEQSRAA